MEAVEAIFQPAEMPAHVQEILTMGLADLFVPVRFIGGSDPHGRLKAVYLTEGLTALRKIKSLPPGEGLEILASVIKGMEQAQRRYLFPEEYILHPALLYLERKDQETRARLIWRSQPGGGHGAESEEVGKSLLTVVYSLKILTEEEGKTALEEAARLILAGKKGMTLIRELENIRKAQRRVIPAGGGLWGIQAPVSSNVQNPAAGR